LKWVRRPDTKSQHLREIFGDSIVFVGIAEDFIASETMTVEEDVWATHEADLMP